MENRPTVEELVEQLIEAAEREGIQIRVVGGRPAHGTEIEEATSGYWQHSWC